jgi:hypothetical protein
MGRQNDRYEWGMERIKKEERHRDNLKRGILSWEVKWELHVGERQTEYKCRVLDLCPCPGSNVKTCHWGL